MALGHEPFSVGHQGKVKESPYGYCFLIEGQPRWFARQFVTITHASAFDIPLWLAVENGFATGNEPVGAVVAESEDEAA